MSSDHGSNVGLTTDRTLRGHTLGLTVDAVNPEVLALLLGPPRPSHRVEVDYVREVPTLGPAPMKRRGLTGKRYRAARRAHRRERQSWVRAGRPMMKVLTRVVVPHVVVSARGA